MTSRERPPEPGIDDRVSGNHLWLLHKCERRLWLDRHAPGEAAPPGEFEELLRRRGEEHEAAVRSRLSPCEGPLHWRGRPLAESLAATRRLLTESRATLYQPALASAAGDAVGVPDFLYWDGETPVIHDAKLASDLEHHGEIALQLTHYGVLLADMGFPAPRLEITNGHDELVSIEPVERGCYDMRRARAAELLRGGPEPDVLLAHSTCQDCPFYVHCWDRAEADGRIEVLPEVTARVAPLLHGRGVRTVDQLAALEPDAVRVKGIGGRAEVLIAEARARRDERPAWLARPALPAGRPIVWIDFEGVTDLVESATPIYLWGLAVEEGAEDIAGEAFVAGPEPDGDRIAWQRFVARAREILDRSPAAVFVHYHAYERTWTKKYAERHGDRDGFVAGRLLPATWDLCIQGVQKWVRLPLRSYSIKAVAPYVGFAWSDPDSGSLWSVVQYGRACAARDPAERRRLLEPILRYNADDLRAMRAVWRWIEREGPRE